MNASNTLLYFFIFFYKQVGSDIPAISADIICTTFDKLALGSCNMVLGPAKDGGYYLVGLSQNEGDGPIELGELPPQATFHITSCQWQAT